MFICPDWLNVKCNLKNFDATTSNSRISKHDCYLLYESGLLILS